MIEFCSHAAGVTNVGLVRRANEDSILLRDDASLWTVADGMGGHHGGKWASEQVRDALDRVVLTGDFDTNLQRIEEAVRAANAAIASEGENTGAQMGTTVVILHVLGSQFAIFWAGDSRVYLCRQGEVYLLTTDHTQVQDMVDCGLITVEEARRHPDKHILSRAVGAVPEIELDLIVDTIEPHDMFLLCSDGLTAVVSDPEIGERIKGASPKAATDDLLELVLSRGAPDNVSLIAVACETRAAPDEDAGMLGGAFDV
jgi:serine/threonine protein phosphatase PrpC